LRSVNGKEQSGGGGRPGCALIAITDDEGCQLPSPPTGAARRHSVGVTPLHQLADLDSGPVR